MQAYKPPFTHRRVGFLEGCPPGEYLRAMEYLGWDPDINPISYQDILHEINVGRILHDVCGHIVFWTDPTWRPTQERTGPLSEEPDDYGPGPAYTSAPLPGAPYDYEYIFRRKYAQLAVPLAPEERYDSDKLRLVGKVSVFIGELRQRIKREYDQWNAIEPEVG